MKAIINVYPRDAAEAASTMRRTHADGRAASLVSGGSDLLAMMKERLVAPDVLVNLRRIKNLDRVVVNADGATIGGLVTLDALSRDPQIVTRYKVLAEAAGSVATPQIRNVATVAGNICQRPWCWYFRNGFPCFKNGGNSCFSYAGENQFHAIFGGGPSYIVHPSDTAVALVALEATFRVAAASGEHVVPAGEFFTLPSKDSARENVLTSDQLLVDLHLPPPLPGTRSLYYKVLDREAWTHAVVSAALVFEMRDDVCHRARVALGGVAPVPWRLKNVEQLLTGERITAALAEQAGRLAVEGARPLAKNGYKVRLTSNVVERTVASLAGLVPGESQDDASE